MKCLLISKGPAANGFSKDQLRNEEFGNLILSAGLCWVGGVPAQIQLFWVGASGCFGSYRKSDQKKTRRKGKE